LGDLFDRNTPTVVALNDVATASGAVTSACAGQFHTLLLTSSGRVYAAGSNSHGQLGSGAGGEAHASRFARIEGALAGATVTAVACGTAHSLALTSGGEVFAWGDASSGQLGLGGCAAAPGDSADGAGADAACVLPPVRVPTRVPGLPAAKLIAAGGGFAGAARDAGAPLPGSHSLVVARDDDTIWAFGDNFYGQLGVPHRYTSVAPFSFGAMPFEFAGVTGNATLRAAAAEDAAAAAATSTRRRRRVRRQLLATSSSGNSSVANATNATNTSAAGGGDETVPPPPPPPPPPAAPPAVAAPVAYSTLAGYLSGARVRPGVSDVAPSRVASRHASPVLVGTLDAGGSRSVIAAISAGGAHSAALSARGEVWAWGDNRAGQLGLGYTSRPYEGDSFFARRASTRPLMVDRPARLTAWDYEEDGVLITGASNAVGGGRFVELHAGVRQTMALTEGGTAWVWGSNERGGLGTCGCGACAAYGAAAASDCAQTAAPPAPPAPPPEELMPEPPPPPPPAPPPGTAASSSRNATGASCACACPGHGNTCVSSVTEEADGTLTPFNAGVCVSGGGYTPVTCECGAPYVSLSGTIDTHDVPMPLDMKGFVFESLAAGGSLFAVSASDCAEDTLGRPCAGNGTCVPGGAGSGSGSGTSGITALCECNEGYVGVACEFHCGKATNADLVAVIKATRGGYKARFPGGLYNPVTEGNMTGLTCSGHGNCTGAQGCACEEGCADAVQCACMHACTHACPDCACVCTRIASQTHRTDAAGLASAASSSALATTRNASAAATVTACTTRPWTPTRTACANTTTARARAPQRGCTFMRTRARARTTTRASASTPASSWACAASARTARAARSAEALQRARRSARRSCWR
jgi:hypothetical protein